MTAQGRPAVRVYADVREEKSGVPEALRDLGAIVIVKNLPMGDYIVSEDYVVERKTVEDFVRSIYDGRLFEQASRLSENYPNVVYVVEGDPEVAFHEKTRARQVTAAMVALMVDYGVRFLWSLKPSQTAEVIFYLAKRVQLDMGHARVVIHRKPRLSSIREWQLYVLQAFPGVGPKTAEAILERFGSIEEFCRATLAELSTVTGLGEKKAETIKKILKARYTKAPRRRTAHLDLDIDS